MRPWLASKIFSPHEAVKVRAALEEKNASGWQSGSLARHLDPGAAQEVDSNGYGPYMRSTDSCTIFCATVVLVAFLLQLPNNWRLARLLTVWPRNGRRPV
jgi:hypothetical protein